MRVEIQNMQKPIQIVKNIIKRWTFTTHGWVCYEVLPTWTQNAVWRMLKINFVQQFLSSGDYERKWKSGTMQQIKTNPDTQRVVQNVMNVSPSPTKVK